MLMNTLVHGGCADIARQSALETGSGRKIPCRTRDSNPCQYCAWLFGRTVYQLNYPRSFPVHLTLFSPKPLEPAWSGVWPGERIRRLLVFWTGCADVTSITVGWSLERSQSRLNALVKSEVLVSSFSFLNDHRSVFSPLLSFPRGLRCTACTIFEVYLFRELDSFGYHKYARLACKFVCFLSWPRF